MVGFRGEEAGVGHLEKVLELCMIVLNGKNSCVRQICNFHSGEMWHSTRSSIEPMVWSRWFIPHPPRLSTLFSRIAYRRLIGQVGDSKVDYTLQHRSIRIICEFILKIALTNNSSRHIRSVVSASQGQQPVKLIILVYYRRRTLLSMQRMFTALIVGGFHSFRCRLSLALKAPLRFSLYISTRERTRRQENFSAIFLLHCDTVKRGSC